MKTLAIATDKGERRVKVASIIGPFAIHPTYGMPGRWTVTHIPTRMAVSFYKQAQWESERLANRIAERLDWEGFLSPQDRETILTGTNIGQVVAALKATGAIT